ncbi:MAG: MerR family transcriptional regulator [Pseudomonadota bacterium]
MEKSKDAFRTIGEISDWLDTPAHVIRFWESRFEAIKPIQKEGGRRYFRPDDMRVLGGLKKLLHEDGLTIKAVQDMISEDGIERVMSEAPEMPHPKELEDASLTMSTNEDTGSQSAPLILDQSLQEPEQKTLVLTPSNEVLEPSHRWHFKFGPDADRKVIADAIASLTELREKLAGQNAN